VSLIPAAFTQYRLAMKEELRVQPSIQCLVVMLACKLLISATFSEKEGVSYDESRSFIDLGCLTAGYGEWLCFYK